MTLIIKGKSTKHIKSFDLQRKREYFIKQGKDINDVLIGKVK